MAERDMPLRSRLWKNIHLSLAFLGVKASGKVLVWMFVGSVQMISRLGSQSKFQMFTLLSDRHVAVTKSSNNMAAP